MYPHSREYQGVKKEKFESAVIAEFELPLSLQNISEDVQLRTSKLDPIPYPWPEYYRNRDLSNIPGVFKSLHPTTAMRLPQGDDTWKLDSSYDILHRPALKQKSNFFKGSIYFRSKLFGRWEPFEFVKYFVNERQDRSDTYDLRIVESIFPVELLEKSLFGSTLEMIIKLEHFLIEESDGQEAVLMKHRVEMNNALLPTSPKSDLRIKVGDEEFFVHMRHMKAFSFVSVGLSKYVDGSIWDWTDKIRADSMQGLLRFIYYDEVDAINTPEIAFHLLQFGHLYQDEALFKICIQLLLSFKDEEFTFPEIFHMYLFVRVHVEFQKLKKHFCGVLSRNAMEYDAKELKDLVESTEGGVGMEALIEILQWEKSLPTETNENDGEGDDDEEEEEESPRVNYAY